MKKAEKSPTWYVKTPEGSIYGPVALSVLCQWADSGRLLRRDEVSRNGRTWAPADSIYALEMHWADADAADDEDVSTVSTEHAASVDQAYAKRKIKRLTALIERLTEQAEVLRTCLNEPEKTAENNKAALLRVAATKKDLAARIKPLEDAAKLAATTVEKARRQAGQAEKARADLAEARKQEQQQFKETYADLAESKKQLQQKTQELTRELHSVRNECEHAQHALDAMKKEREDLLHRNQVTEKNFSERIERLVEDNRGLEAAKKQAQEQQERYEALSQEKSAEQLRLNQRIHQLSHELDGAMRESESARQIHEQLSAQIARLLQDSHELKSAKEKIQEQEKRFHVLAQQSAVQQRQLTQQVQELSQQLEKAGRVSEQTKRELAAQISKYSALTEESFRNEARMKAQIQRLKAQAEGVRWYVRIDKGAVSGPVDLSVLRAWAKQCRIGPGDEVSEDKNAWAPIESIPELEMDWLINLPGNETYGPLNATAIAELVKEGLIPEAAKLTNRHTEEISSINKLIMGN